MERLVKNYYFKIRKLFNFIEVKDHLGRKITFYKGVSNAAELIKKQASFGKKLVFIGNGASAAISSHQATDFWKNAGIPAIAFNDASLLTCVSNDFGYNRVFEKPIEMFAEPGDILIAISSSGRSKNVLRGVKAAKRKGAKVITLSGLLRNNPLIKLGEINFYVPSSIYGHVEITHHSICHCVLDLIIHTKSIQNKK